MPSTHSRYSSCTHLLQKAVCGLWLHLAWFGPPPLPPEAAQSPVLVASPLAVSNVLEDFQRVSQPRQEHSLSSEQELVYHTQPVKEEGGREGGGRKREGRRGREKRERWKREGTIKQHLLRSFVDR